MPGAATTATRALITLIGAERSTEVVVERYNEQSGRMRFQKGAVSGAVHVCTFPTKPTGACTAYMHMLVHSTSIHA